MKKNYSQIFYSVSHQLSSQSVVTLKLFMTKLIKKIIFKMSVVKLILIFYFFKSSNCFDCGEVKINLPTGLSEGGKESYAGQWPWLAALFKNNTPGQPFEYFCGASLINKRTLLTGEFEIFFLDLNKF